MWGQIIKARVKPGQEEELERLSSELQRRVTSRSGLKRVIRMRNQRDHLEVYTLIVFETEEQARADEQGLDDDEFFKRVRATFDGQPEYIDLDVIDDHSV